MVKGEFTLGELDLLKFAIKEIVDRGGNLESMRCYLDLYDKIDNYQKKVFEEMTVND